jgi:hypothetical protein
MRVEEEGGKESTKFTSSEPRMLWDSDVIPSDAKIDADSHNWVRAGQ